MEWFNFEQDLNSADKMVSNEQENSIVSNLHNILKPFLLRRIKLEVAKDLPRKLEILVYCPLMPEQKSLYTSVLKGFHSLRQELVPGSNDVPVLASKRKHGDMDCYRDVSDEEYFNQIADSIERSERNGDKENLKISSEFDQKLKGLGQMRLGNITMQLRKVCNHVLMFELPVVEDPSSQNDASHDDNDENSNSNSEEKGKALISNPEYGIPARNILIRSLPDIVYTSGKMLMLERMLPELLYSGHQVLIFSQMTKVLDIVADYFDMKEWPFCRIDGAVKMADRQDQIESFQAGEVKLFLLSTRSGGISE